MRGYHGQRNPSLPAPKGRAGGGISLTRVGLNPNWHGAFALGLVPLAIFESMFSSLRSAGSSGGGSPSQGFSFGSKLGFNAMVHLREWVQECVGMAKSTIADLCHVLMTSYICNFTAAFALTIVRHTLLINVVPQVIKRETCIAMLMVIRVRTIAIVFFNRQTSISTSISTKDNWKVVVEKETWICFPF